MHKFLVYRESEYAATVRYSPISNSLSGSPSCTAASDHSDSTSSDHSETPNQRSIRPASSSTSERTTLAFTVSSEPGLSSTTITVSSETLGSDDKPTEWSSDTTLSSTSTTDSETASLEALEAQEITLDEKEKNKASSLPEPWVLNLNNDFVSEGFSFDENRDPFDEQPMSSSDELPTSSSIKENTVPAPAAAIYWRSRVTGQVIAPNEVMYTMYMNPLVEKDLDTVEKTAVKHYGPWMRTGSAAELTTLVPASYVTRVSSSKAKEQLPESTVYVEMAQVEFSDTFPELARLFDDCDNPSDDTGCGDPYEAFDKDIDSPGVSQCPSWVDWDSEAESLPEGIPIAGTRKVEMEKEVEMWSSSVAEETILPAECFTQSEESSDAESIPPTLLPTKPTDIDNSTPETLEGTEKVETRDSTPVINYPTQTSPEALWSLTIQAEVVSPGDTVYTVKRHRLDEDVATCDVTVTRQGIWGTSGSTVQLQCVMTSAQFVSSKIINKELLELLASDQPWDWQMSHEHFTSMFPGTVDMLFDAASVTYRRNKLVNGKVAFCFTDQADHSENTSSPSPTSPSPVLDSPSLPDDPSPAVSPVNPDFFWYGTPPRTPSPSEFLIASVQGQVATSGVVKFVVTLDPLDERGVDAVDDMKTSRHLTWGEPGSSVKLTDLVIPADYVSRVNFEDEQKAPSSHWGRSMTKCDLKTYFPELAEMVEDAVEPPAAPAPKCNAPKKVFLKRYMDETESEGQHLTSADFCRGHLINRLKPMAAAHKITERADHGHTPPDPRMRKYFYSYMPTLTLSTLQDAASQLQSLQFAAFTDMKKRQSSYSNTQTSPAESSPAMSSSSASSTPSKKLPFESLCTRKRKAYQEDLESTTSPAESSPAMSSSPASSTPSKKLPLESLCTRKRKAYQEDLEPTRTADTRKKRQRYSYSDTQTSPAETSPAMSPTSASSTPSEKLPLESTLCTRKRKACQEDLEPTRTADTRNKKQRYSYSDTQSSSTETSPSETSSAMSSCSAQSTPHEMLPLDLRCARKREACHEDLEPTRTADTRNKKQRSNAGTQTSPTEAFPALLPCSAWTTPREMLPLDLRCPRKRKACDKDLEPTRSADTCLIKVAKYRRHYYK